MKAAAAGLDASAAPSGAPGSPAPVPEGYLLVGTQGTEVDAARQQCCCVQVAQWDHLLPAMLVCRTDDTPEPSGDAEMCPSSAQSPQPSATVMESAIKVTVKEPERLEASAALGLKTQHWVYAITTDSTLPGLVASNVMVRRRFSEFEVSKQAPGRHAGGKPSPLWHGSACITMVLTPAVAPCCHHRPFTKCCQQNTSAASCRRCRKRRSLKTTQRTSCAGAARTCKCVLLPVPAIYSSHLPCTLASDYHPLALLRCCQFVPLPRCTCGP